MKHNRNSLELTEDENIAKKQRLYVRYVASSALESSLEALYPDQPLNPQPVAEPTITPAEAIYSDTPVTVPGSVMNASLSGIDQIRLDVEAAHQSTN